MREQHKRWLLSGRHQLHPRAFASGLMLDDRLDDAVSNVVHVYFEPVQCTPIRSSQKVRLTQSLQQESNIPQLLNGDGSVLDEINQASTCS